MSEPSLSLVSEPGRKKRLVDVLPPEFLEGAYENTPAMKYAFIEVLASYHSQDRPWPGEHRHISMWHILANGKAVGWNENPRRWSFPVMRSPEARPEYTRMRFDNALHRDCFRVLTNHEFIPRVTNDLIVGHEFSHPMKPVRVVLKIVDGDLEYCCLKPTGETYDEMAYTIDEWNWITNSTDVSESLHRELNILLHVRPDTMIFDAC